MIKTEVTMSPMVRVFPALYRHVASGLVVLFVDQQKGTILHVGGSNRIFGEYYEEFACCDDRSLWVPLLPGESVTLTVE